MSRIMNITLAAAGACLLGAFGALLDGPSDADIAKATAADLADAKTRARHEAEMLARCRTLNGPRAEIFLIRDSDDYACGVPARSY